ncbi:MAG: hypothetical protein NTW08_08080 [Gammaproteobacteria bacterium]|nr:hypothetical protein [Gammaproteobacteria bacterium]
MTNARLIGVTCISLLTSTTAFSTLPPAIPGFYTGLTVLGSYPQSTTNILSPARPTNGTNPTLEFNTTGTLKQGIGGGGQYQLGYRFPCFRIEGEFLYNYNQNSSLTFNDATFNSNKYTGQYYLAGATQQYMGLANFYYDFRPAEATRTSNVFPYAGVGIGYAKFTTITNYSIPQIQGAAPITRPDYLLGNTNGVKTSIYTTAPVIQGIVGLDLAMDSYMDFFIDFRYLMTSSITSYGASYQIATGNLGVNFLLGKGLG